MKIPWAQGVRKPQPPFRLTRYFSIASFVALDEVKSRALHLARLAAAEQSQVVGVCVRCRTSLHGAG